MCVCVNTFNVGDVDVELGEFLTRPLHALVHRLQDLFGVLLHPPERQRQRESQHVSKPCSGSVPDLFHSPFFGEALFDLHLMMAEELCCFGVEHLQREEEKRKSRT